MQGDEGGRARGVDGDGRSLEAEGVGDPAGEDAARVPDADERPHVVGYVAGAGAVVVVHQAGEDAGPAALEGQRVDPGPFEGLPRGFQQQPLLRVHRQGLARRDTEEVRVELGGVVEESPLDVEHVPGAAEQALEVPPPVRREGTDSVAAGGHEAPQVLRAGHGAWVAAAHADDRDGFALAVLDVAEALPCSAEVRRDASQVVAQLLFVVHQPNPIAAINRRGPTTRDGRTRPSHWATTCGLRNSWETPRRLPRTREFPHIDRCRTPGCPLTGKPTVGTADEQPLRGHPPPLSSHYPAHGSRCSRWLRARRRVRGRQHSAGSPTTSDDVMTIRRMPSSGTRSTGGARTTTARAAATGKRPSPQCGDGPARIRNGAPIFPVRIPAWRFRSGASAGEDEREPIHHGTREQ